LLTRTYIVQRRNQELRFGKVKPNIDEAPFHLSTGEAQNIEDVRIDDFPLSRKFRIVMLSNDTNWKPVEALCFHFVPISVVRPVVSSFVSCQQTCPHGG